MGRFKLQAEQADGASTFALTDKLVLGGRIVTMDAKRTVHPAGYVCIDSNKITAVVSDRASIPPSFPASAVRETKGTIYPGLIELHDHPPYNFIPLWNVPGPYKNRNTWINDEPRYLYDIRWPAQVIAFNSDETYGRAVARYVECRSLCGGATTFQGVAVNDGWYNGLARNAEAPGDTKLPAASGKVSDYLPDKIATDLVTAINPKVNRTFFYHLSEGTDDPARKCFLDLQYEPGKWAINGNLAAIHCVGLQPADFAQLAAGGVAGVIWSPLSNYMLYGETMKIAAAKASGVRLCIGADWGPSGSKNLLGELKIARIASELAGGLFSAAELVAMATCNPAEVLQWGHLVGSIAPQKYADLLILAGTAGDPYDQLIDAAETDIAAVVVGGQPRLGQEGLLEFSPASQEPLSIGGQRYIIDLAADDGSALGPPSLADATGLLTKAMANLPDLARGHKAFFAQLAANPEAHPRLMSLAARGAWGVDLEFEPEKHGIQDYILAAAKIDPDKLYPMKLAPLTLVDDPDYIPTVKANINLPPEVRTRL